MIQHLLPVKQATELYMQPVREVQGSSMCDDPGRQDRGQENDTEASNDVYIHQSIIFAWSTLSSKEREKASVRDRITCCHLGTRVDPRGRGLGWVVANAPPSVPLDSRKLKIQDNDTLELIWKDEEEINQAHTSGRNERRP